MSKGHADRARRWMDRAVWKGAGAGIVAVFLFWGVGMGEPPTRELAVRVGTEIAEGGDGLPIRVSMIHHRGAAIEPVALPSGFEAHVTDSSGGLSRVRLEEGAFGHVEGWVPMTGALPMTIALQSEIGDEVSRVVVGVVGASSPGRPRLEYRDMHLPAEGVGMGDDGGVVVRATGGLCVPNIPCELLIWVASASPGDRLELGEGVQQLGEELPPALSEEAKIVSMRVRLSQARGAVWLVRGEGGARERLSWSPIPVALSSGYLSESASHRFTLAQELDPEEIIADVFLDGRWVHTVSRTGAEVQLDAPWGANGLRPGLWRLQLRGEELREGAAGVRVYWGPQAGGPAYSAEGLESSLRGVGWSPDDFSAEVLGDTGLWERQPQMAQAFILARFEAAFRYLPPRVYGGPQRLAELEERRDRGRLLGAVVILLMGVLVTIFILGRGRRASSEAGAVMRAARDATGHQGGGTSRVERVLQVVSGAALVLLAFLFVAALLYSKEYF